MAQYGRLKRAERRLPALAVLILVLVSTLTVAPEVATGRRNRPR